MSMIEIRIPDIGDFKDVPIIEVHVKPGDKVAVEDPLLTLESDKATLEVPCPQAGTIGEVKVKTGDKVSEGDLIVMLEAEGGAAIPPKEKVTEDAAPSAGNGQAGYGSPAGAYEYDRGQGPRHRRLQGRAGDRDPGEGRRHHQRRRPADDAGIRQGDDGDPVAGGGHRRRDQDQGRRPGVPGRHHHDAPDAGRRQAQRRRRDHAAADAGQRAGGQAGQHRGGRYPRRGAGAGCRAGRLHRRVPRRRPWQAGGADRALAAHWAASA